MDERFFVMERPEWISFDEIADLLHEAHRENVRKGLNYSAATQNGEEIRRRLHDKGLFFVAITHDNKLVGASAVEIKERLTSWYGKNRPYAEISMEGVLPDYQGKGINSLIRAAISDYAFSYVDLLVLDTAEKNRHAIAVNQKRGWLCVDYRSWKTNDFYSVVMAKWKNDCPYSEAYLRRRFLIRKWKTKLHYTNKGRTRWFLMLYDQLR